MAEPPQAFGASFFTLRQLTTSLPFTTTWQGYANPVAVDQAGSEDPCDVYQDESYLYIGLVTGFECRGLVGYDLAPIPAGAQLTDASLSCSYGATAGNPWLYGAVTLDHVRFGTSADGFGTSELAALGPLFTPDAASATKSVKDAVALDLADKSPTSEFRLRMANGVVGGSHLSNYVDWHDNDRGGCAPLSVSYLVPCASISAGRNFKNGDRAARRNAAQLGAWRHEVGRGGTPGFA